MVHTNKKTMKRSLMISNLRIELRRKQAGYVTERNAIQWVNRFFDEMSIVHSSQIRPWQKEHFLAGIKKDDHTSFEDQLQAKSSLLFLYDRVLKRTSGFSLQADSEDVDTEPGSFRFTA